MFKKNVEPADEINPARTEHVGSQSNELPEPLEHYSPIWVLKHNADFNPNYAGSVAALLGCDHERDD